MSADRRKLAARCHELEATLRAIRAGDVDAVVGANGDSVITLAGVDLAWRLLFDHMNEGAVTLTSGGVIAYGNRCFAGLLRMPAAGLVGKPLRRFVAPAERTAFDALVARGCRSGARGEGTLVNARGAAVPVAVSFAPLRAAAAGPVIGAVGVVTDLSSRIRAERARRRLVQEAAATIDDERRHVALELHDETGQSLAALLVGLRAIEDARTMTEAADRAHQLRRVAAHTLDEVGRLARGLHPRILEDLGLVAALRRHAAEFAQLHGVAVTVCCEGLGSDGLPSAVQSTLYRLFQEALTNVARHAAARRVTITLRQRHDVIELRIRDDGTGFDPAARRAAGRRRLGLKAMHERAALLGGSVAVTSLPGSGTTIAASYPVGGSAAAAPAVARKRPRAPAA
jgi:PAS domain S-box-containing protein